MRKLRLLATLVPLVAIAFPAAAQLDKFKDWEKSPEFVYYATEDEQNAWKGVKSDEEAQKFFNLFWGRRHPDYQKTQQNVFRMKFDALVTEADKRFTLGKKREPSPSAARSSSSSGRRRRSPRRPSPGPDPARGSTTERAACSAGPAGR